jgi:hypothetical protein
LCFNQAEILISAAFSSGPFEILTSSYNAWQSFSTASFIDDEALTLYTSLFLALLDNIPAFRSPPLDQVPIVTTDDLLIECALQWETATGPDCDQRNKSTKFYQMLGCAEPSIIDFSDGTEEKQPWYPGFPAERRRELTCLVLAWSYVICCRWVEILRNAGEKAFLYYESPDYKAIDSWDVVVKCRWKAVIIRKEETFCAPWLLEMVDYDMSDRYVTALPSIKARNN